MVSGSGNGLYLWNTSNKNPTYKMLKAHEIYQNSNISNINEMSNIQSISSCPKSDLIV